MNMEKEFFGNDGCSNFYGIDFNPNWDNNNSMMDQSDLFDSTLTSIVSSPVNSHAGNLVGGGGENVMMRELLGRLGSICNSGEIGTITNNSSSYNNTPLNSPPKLNLSVMESHIRGNLSLSGSNLAPFSADPGFAERAARLSCFGNGGRNLSSLNELGKVESGKLSRVSSNKSFNIAGIGSQLGIQEKGGDLIPVPNKKLNRFSRSSTPENNADDSREGSSVSEQITSRELGGSKANTRKRKSVHTGEAKDIKAAVAEKNESNGKKIKPNEVPKKEMDAAKDGTKTDGDANQKQTNDNSKPPEPPKDYIHVRARRGQATDSHSLAERVRREKISKRMKFLQDLVPGCNKVTGKAVMLDEIINYVQSLQRQVEFLSMKLATVNPRMDLNMETLLPKDIFKCPSSLPHTLHPLDSSVPTFAYEYQSMHMPSLHNDISHGTEKQFPITSATDLMQRNLSGQVPNGYSEVGIDISKFWENDLHSLVQMGYGQNQLQNGNGPMAADQMKSEL